MSQQDNRQLQVSAALANVTPPTGVSIRAWREEDFPTISRLSSAEGWPTPESRPEEALTAWRNSWPALVATDGEAVIGFVRGLTDGEVTMYVAELLVDAEWRRKGIGSMLLEMCHQLHPHARIEVFSTESSASFYRTHGFRYIGEGFRRSYR